MTQTAEGSKLPMPAAFIGHGTPMNALDRNRFTDAWRAFGASVPRPRAILVISAHWYIHASAVTAMPQSLGCQVLQSDERRGSPALPPVPADETDM